MKVRVKLCLVNGRNEPFMGIGLVWLLRRVERLGSIQLAAKDMGMSYAKAHRILKRLEQGVGHKLLLRRKGGHERGGAELTSFAQSFLARYSRHNDRVSCYAQKEFAHLIGTLR